MTGAAQSERLGETAARTQAAVSLYVALVAAAAVAAGLLAVLRDPSPLPLDLVAFVALATVTDLREVRLPVVGVVTLSFVPVLAALIVFGLWPALLVAAVSGLATAWFTRDPVKILFNAANYALSTFLAGLIYLALVPPGEHLLDKVLPTFAATAVDFFASTVLLAGVVAMASGERALRIWRQNYQWGLPSYLTGSTIALLVAWLYLAFGIAGLILVLPPLYLIYYSYDIYVKRVRDTAAFGAEIASFKEELAASSALHDELRATQTKVAAEIERARRIQHDLLPAAAPEVPGLALEQRIEFLGEMGGDYYDYLDFGDGRLGVVCGDVMGKGLAAALIMAMARSLLHETVAPGRSPGDVLHDVNESLARDLDGQSLPYFLTLTLLAYDPEIRTATVASAGHNPVLVLGEDGARRLPARGAVLGVRAGLDFPEDVIALSPGDRLALYTDGLTEARAPGGELFGVDRLEELLARCRGRGLGDALGTTWAEIAAFRGEAPSSDDATLLLLEVAPS
ncbi:MAG TPA: PP2C family protein-serine/threonine phosphatase [Thermoleophilia bacterium]|nr:PP2C family protein-serine/threonine phosphatase [Thermoleophilia bacterium]